MYAKIGEGAAFVGGIVLLAVTKVPSDCDGMTGTMPGVDSDHDSCREHARIAEGIGVTLILAGLAGFIATVSTSPDAQPAPTSITMQPVAAQPSTPTPTPTPATSPIPLPAPAPVSGARARADSCARRAAGHELIGLGLGLGLGKTARSQAGCA